MCSKRNELNKQIIECRSQLSNVCPSVLLRSIHAKIQALNSKLFHHLEQTKNKKLENLTNSPKNRTEPLENQNQNHHTVVTIPENLPLSNAEKSVLSKGLNFVPISKKSDEFTTRQDVEKFLRRVQLKAFFHNKEDKSDNTEKDAFQTLTAKKSKWTPPEGQFASIDYFIKKCRHDVHKLKSNCNTKLSNLSKEEWTALINLKNRDDLVIKAADKGGATVVWRTDLYQQEAIRQLSDPTFYTKVNKDLTLANQKIVKDTIQELITKQELPVTAQNLIITTPRTSCIYFKPKIHKPNNPGRPIVSACSCPTELISSYLDKVMTPIVKSLPSYIKDSNHALETFRNFNFSGENKIIFTMDITSLYTVIPNNEGLQALKYFFNQRPIKKPSSETLLRLAELVLTLNCFSFGDNYYKQINGVAMGTKMGPSYANLFVGFIENKFFSNYHGPKPDLYKRYIDDCVGATSSSKEELNLFINSVNSFHPALKYTWEISENSLAFLDIKLSINDNGLSTSVHYKPTDSHNYLLHSSSHPQHVKNAIPFSQFLRLRRLCSDDTDFNNKCEEMCQFFKKRGYPDSAVTTGKHRAQEIDRETALQTSQNEETDRIPFTLTYHPQNLAIKNVILKNFKILSNDPETKHIFSLPPLISFKRDKNLGNFLVRSAFKFNNKPGTFTCKRTRCKTCPFISNTVNISGPNRSVKVTDHFTCISSNVIYCITCTLCKKIYIGETGRRLADRFREHLRDAEQNNTDASKPVARHFNLPNHSHHNMTICGLYLHHGNTESRKNLEQKLIFQLGTLSPHGINERLSFH